MAKRLDIHDDYLTTTSLAALCLETFRKVAPDCALHVEPSAGAGAFLHQMPVPSIGLDINPAAPGIETADFMTWSPPAVDGPIAVIGNPPFNARHGNAVGFFNHAAGFADWIAMIMPAAFARPSVQRRLDPRFECVHHEALPGAVFSKDSCPVQLNVCFQIWRRSSTERPQIKEVRTHADFEFVRSAAEADFALRRVGARAGAVVQIRKGEEDARGLSPQSNYFIRVTGGDRDGVEARLRTIDFGVIHEASGPVASLTKPDLIALYEAAHVVCSERPGAPIDAGPPLADLMQDLEEARANHASVGTALASQLGQVMTPTPVAGQMAGMFGPLPKEVRLLDPGAGMGVLTAAFVSEAISRADRPSSIDVTAYERDADLLPCLEDTLSVCERICARAGISFTGHVVHGDFLSSQVEPGTPGYTHVITNPPYAKFPAKSPVREALADRGHRVNNLYAAFMAVALDQLEDGGEMVSLTPRSWCNGTMFAQFRRNLLEISAIRGLHLYGSRREVFLPQKVTQEVVATHVEKGGLPTVVALSTDDGLSRSVPALDVVDPWDSARFVRFPVSTDGAGDPVARLPGRLEGLGVSVSTGQVVPFRVPGATSTPEAEVSVPLITANHLSGPSVTWPLAGLGRAQYLAVSPATASMILPAGSYVAVKRVTVKEEARRVHARLYTGNAVAFENHLNVLHQKGRGLPTDLARGLLAYLNSAEVDNHIRGYSGSTQINAADLRVLPYPSREELEAIGRGQLAVDEVLMRARGHTVVAR